MSVKIHLPFRITGKEQLPKCGIDISEDGVEISPLGEGTDLFISRPLTTITTTRPNMPKTKITVLDIGFTASQKDKKGRSFPRFLRTAAGLIIHSEPDEELVLNGLIFSPVKKIN